MPVAKTNGNEGSRKTIPQSHDCCFNKDCSRDIRKRTYCGEISRKILWTFVGILLAYMIVLVGAMIRNRIQEFNFIGQAPRGERIITIDAEGKVSVNPDIAVVTMGMTNEAKTIVEAQQKNTAVMNTLLQKLGALAIAKNDIQTTNYTIFPQYDYSDNGQKLRGYRVDQNVTVKIRDLEKANAVLSLAGEVGANTVDGLRFTVDDRVVYVAEAREDALEKIREKARLIASNLGVSFVEIVSYNEFESGSDGLTPKAYDSLGFGSEGGPIIEPGSMYVILQVSVSFAIR